MCGVLFIVLSQSVDIIDGLTDIVTNEYWFLICLEEIFELNFAYSIFFAALAIPTDPRVSTI